ncbi:DgyrCDS2061 [Dimorphilus gyrociliatus]|uniref:DgyrCDS2061 n=1 Tax=Dimorphilus gyrociliatus TaxID=2664684 RepID=A0A7I8VC85_9ANNE|nr:DgyrCDS2061 [Dimorphilus gyrociliatus]
MQCASPTRYLDDDPDLCVTPLRELKNLDERKPVRVRFDKTVKIQEVSPNQSSSLDLSMSDNENNSLEIIDIQPKTLVSHDFTLSSKIDLSEPVENVLFRPELNSTLRTKQKMKLIEQEEVDLCSAVEKKLKTPSVREFVKGKITSKVNANEDFYRNLQSVDTMENESLFIKPVKTTKQREAKEALVDSPMLDEFDRGNIQKESLSLTLHSQPRFEVGLVRVPPSAGFIVYEHSRTYDGLA